MKINKFLLGLLCGLLVIPLLALSFYSADSPRTAFVDVQQLFAKFKGKQELETRLNHISSQQQASLDSLNLRIKAIQRKLIELPNNQNLQLALQQGQLNYQQRQEVYSQQYDAQSNRYTEAIWQQINEYVKSYGETNGYDYIYGTSNNGNLMYANKAKDITEQIIQHINNRYEGF